MQLNINAIQAWLEERNLREKIFLIVAFFIITYFLWGFIVNDAIVHKKEQINKEISVKTSEIEAINNQLNSLKNIISQNKNKYLQQEMLSGRIQDFQKNIENLLKSVVPVTKLPMVMNDILNQHQSGITVLNLKHSADQPWITDADLKKQLSDSAKKIYKYNLELGISGNYFAVIAYLQSLEKLSWHLYWDSMNYKVTNYPQADVLIKFYILSSPE